MKQLIVVVAGALLIGSAWAQSASAPAGSRLPAASDMPPTDPVSSTTAATPTANAPGANSGDTSGKVAGNQDAAATSSCDANYNKAQVHGSTTTTVVAGNHVSGTYNAAAFDVSKHYGDCDDPHHGVTISVSAHVSNGNAQVQRGRW